MKLATWNVNSLTVRLGQVEEWIKKEKPDHVPLPKVDRRQMGAKGLQFILPENKALDNIRSLAWDFKESGDISTDVYNKIQELLTQHRNTRPLRAKAPVRKKILDMSKDHIYNREKSERGKGQYHPSRQSA
mgnify:CR=1 FL=1